MKEDNLVKIKDFQEYQQVWQSEVSPAVWNDACTEKQERKQGKLEISSL